MCATEGPPGCGPLSGYRTASPRTPRWPSHTDSPSALGQPWKLRLGSGYAHGNGHLSCVCVCAFVRVSVCLSVCVRRFTDPWARVQERPSGALTLTLTLTLTFRGSWAAAAASVTHAAFSVSSCSAFFFVSSGSGQGKPTQHGRWLPARFKNGSRAVQGRFEEGRRRGHRRTPGRGRRNRRAPSS